MKTEQPFISVVIPVFDAEKYVEETIRSVLDQTYHDFEIIVVDDGSTDGSMEIVRSLSKDIRIFSQANRGCAAACTAGMKAANGEFIQVLGADDILYPEKFERQMGIFVEDESLDIVFCDAVKFSADSNNVKKYKRRNIPHRWLRGKKDLLKVLLKRNVISAVTPLVRKRWYERVGYYDERLTNLEDWNAYLRMVQLGARFQYTDEVLAGIRRHGKNKSDNASQANNARTRILDYFFEDFGEHYLERAKRFAYSYAYLENARLYRAAHDYTMFRHDLYKALGMNPLLLMRHPILIWKVIRSYLKSKR
jgi:glycosyltransferase involved in cell wall biosynthesis